MIRVDILQPQLESIESATVLASRQTRTVACLERAMAVWSL